MGVAARQICYDDDAAFYPEVIITLFFFFFFFFSVKYPLNSCATLIRALHL